MSDWRGVFVRGYHGRMRYRLRTLLILLAVGPIMLAGIWFAYCDYRERCLLDFGPGVTIFSEE